MSIRESNSDVFGLLIFRRIVCNRKSSLIVREERRRWENNAEFVKHILYIRASASRAALESARVLL